MVQQASFDDFTYEVDVTRNVASKKRTTSDKPAETLHPNIDLYRSMPVSILI